jgi:hypothetical protein
LGDAVSITAAQARERAIADRAGLRAGIDPVAVAVKQEEDAEVARQIAVARKSFSEVVEAYLDAFARGRLAQQSRVPHPRSIDTETSDLPRVQRLWAGRVVADLGVPDAHG